MRCKGNILTHKLHSIIDGANKFGDIKFYVLFIAGTTLALAVLAIPAISPLTKSITIHSSGQISTTTVWAESGYPEDIQAAVDAVAAAGGGTVYVPEGEFVFNPGKSYDGNIIGVFIPGGVNVIGMGKDKTILRQTIVTGTAVMFYVDGSNDKPTRISGITFVGLVVNETYSITGVLMRNSKGFRVDNCKFIDFNGAGVAAGVYTVAVRNEGGELQYYWNWGVIDHNDFDNPYKDTIGGSWGYGIIVSGPGRPDAWLYNMNDILGRWDIGTTPIRSALYQWNETAQKYELVDPYGGKYFRWLVYIEDNTFSRTRHAVASNSEAFYVFRYNTVEKPRPYNLVDIHGALQPDWWGGRGAEIYNNTLSLDKEGLAGIDYRGGGGVAFNNTIMNSTYGIRLSSDAIQEVSLVKDLWIWDNTFIDVGTQIHIYNYPYKEGSDYFLQQKPGYTPYPYPHQLTKVAP